ncbi:hypothetical protein B0H12DRAFT_1124958 [Mycena haematopus]|nr:hypothetical protein B0H12DRAFT_1124958 [Mycena haematopus]
MHDPWAFIDAALEAATPPVTAPRTKWGAGAIGDVKIGDIAICREGSRLRYIFYDYLVSNGYVLTKEERKLFDILKLEVQTEPPYARPCVVLERHSIGSFKVCFKATLEDDLNASVFTSLSIPAGDRGLLSYPPPTHDAPIGQRGIIPLPVIRSSSNLVAIRRSNFVREQLHYGELERAKTLIQEKAELLAARHKEIRAQELALLNDPTHPANRAKEEPSQLSFRPAIFVTLKKKIYRKVGFMPMYNSRFIPSRVIHNNNIQWVLQHAQEDITAASRYLSSVEHPPPSPFHLPRPFYSTMLRASTAFVRRRIFQ